MAPQSLGSFSRILQSEFLLTDSKWCYQVSELPGPKATNPGRWVKSLDLECSPTTQKLQLRLIKIDQNRAINTRELDHLIHFSFSSFRLGKVVEDEWQGCTARETGDYLVRLLQHGIKLNGILYSFYGHSNSQLKLRSCYLLRGSKEEVAWLVESLGDFSKIQTVAKKAKRVGLLFSSCHALLKVADGRYEDIDDIETSGYNFTDGCGLVGESTARLLSQKLKIVIHNQRYHPSVFQIRFKGYKGIVSLEPKLRKGCYFQFRASMRKFSGTTDSSFAVIEYSQPYTYGYLNDDIVLLLHALGITKDMLLKKQRGHFQRLQDSLTDPALAFVVLSSLGRLDLAEKLVLSGIEKIASPLRGLVNGEFAKMLNKRQEHKCRILVPDSRLVFGICDPRAVLEEGECFLRITDDMYGRRPRTIHGCEVLVTRNPCLHPGDLRKLKAVDKPELAHLTDCIVFPVKGKRPAVDQMSGGDLDGDKFFVCWDPDLVPATMSEPAEYPPDNAPVSFQGITVDDWIEYFARYSSASLGRVKKLFLQWAVHKGALSRECQELNRLHSLSVDGNRIRIPDRLTAVPPIDDDISQGFILNILHEEARNVAQNKLLAPTPRSKDDTREDIETILCQPRTCSEFSILRLVYDWCCKTGEANISELLHYFDLSAMAPEERHWLLRALPTSIEYPSLVMNGLLNSAILERQELAPFHLEYPGMRWKRIFSADDRLANLFEVIAKSFSEFHRKLLVLKVHERLTVAIYIQQQIAPEDEALVGQGVRVIAFPHTQELGNRRDRIHATKMTYRLCYDHNTFQLYQSTRQNTFVWIGRPGKNDSYYKSVKGSANRTRERQKTIDAGITRDWVTSIALDRFSAHTKTQIGRVYRDGISAAVSGYPKCSQHVIAFTTARTKLAYKTQELYVISNTDVKSFQTLDLWMESVDTMETIPLFEKVPPPLTIPKLATADLTSQPEDVRGFFESGDISLLDQASLQRKIVTILQVCFDHAGSSLSGSIYEHYLQSSEVVAAWAMPEELLEGLIQGLIYTPGHVVFFAALSPWQESFPRALSQTLKAQSLRLLKATLQAANTIGTFALETLKTILGEIDSLSLEYFQEIVEDASLLLKSPDQLLDICLDALANASERLIHESDIVRDYFTRHMFAIALDHCEEATESASPKDDLWAFEPFTPSSAPPALVSHRRLDAPQLERLAAGDHVQFELARYPENIFLTEKPTFDATIESSTQGSVTFLCLSYPPAYCVSARWRMKHCGSFVTSRAMLDSLISLIKDKQSACALYPLLIENKPLKHYSSDDDKYEHRTDLNECQNQAVDDSLRSRLTCIWGPPGTGKTQTVAAILQELIARRPEDRILVTAPTHNAVDNILKRYLRVVGPASLKPLRVSTNIRKVDRELLGYTCDGMERKEIGHNRASKNKALERIQQARLIFTTCAGAGLGLLRGEEFPIVIIDESSQQTEPMSLVPLTKGCQKAILVGDHVQLRATVRKYTKALGFEISLFERLYTFENLPEGSLQRVMLNVQYRMHPRICEFPSQEFYEGKLKADISCERNTLSEHGFPWPEIHSPDGQLERCVFVPCLGEEEVGYRSKGNLLQAELCKEIYRLIGSTSESIAVLTPYTRQVKILKDRLTGSATVTSIDRFQGQEADIIIYVTVRSNPHGDIGFLSDLRRLNVVLTRARSGLIVIGCPRTLMNAASLNSENKKASSNLSGSRAVDQEAGSVWKRLIQSLKRVDISLVSQ